MTAGDASVCKSVASAVVVENGGVEQMRPAGGKSGVDVNAATNRFFHSPRFKPLKPGENHVENGSVDQVRAAGGKGGVDVNAAQNRFFYSPRFRQSKPGENNELKGSGQATERKTLDRPAAPWAESCFDDAVTPMPAPKGKPTNADKPASDALRRVNDRRMLMPYERGMERVAFQPQIRASHEMYECLRDPLAASRGGQTSTRGGDTCGMTPDTDAVFSEYSPSACDKSGFETRMQKSRRSEASTCRTPRGSAAASQSVASTPRGSRQGSEAGGLGGSTCSGASGWSRRSAPISASSRSAEVSTTLAAKLRGSGGGSCAGASAPPADDHWPQHISPTYGHGTESNAPSRRSSVGSESNFSYGGFSYQHVRRRMDRSAGI